MTKDVVEEAARAWLTDREYRQRVAERQVRVFGLLGVIFIPAMFIFLLWPR